MRNFVWPLTVTFIEKCKVEVVYELSGQLAYNAIRGHTDNFLASWFNSYCPLRGYFDEFIEFKRVLLLYKRDIKFI